MYILKYLPVLQTWFIRHDEIIVDCHMLPGGSDNMLVFNKNSYSVLYELGGNKCNKLHYNFITNPIIKKRIGISNIIANI